MSVPSFLPRLRVLVVDDDPISTNIVERLLSNLGIDGVTIAHHATIALSHLSNEYFEVLICDLNMPGFDGIQLLQQVATLRNPPAVLLASGEDMRVLETAQLYAGSLRLQLLGVIQKPFTQSVVAELLGRFLVPLVAAPQTSYSFSEEQLEYGLENQCVWVAHQPQVNLINGCLCGVECLLRWRTSDGRTYTPQQILDTAEHCGATDRLFLAILVSALRDQHLLYSSGLDANISVNFSVSNLRDPAIVEQILQAVVSNGSHPSRVTLELTETQIIEQPTPVMHALLRLRLLGFNISIDDYGTGAATLEQLRRLPAGELKIDRSFVQEGVRSDSGRLILSSAVTLGLSLGLQVVAEGVETQAELDLIKDLGCHVGQGYWFSRPLSVEDLALWAAVWTHS